MIKNVIECNNGEVDKSNFKVEGDYPKCFFGLTFADYIDVRICKDTKSKCLPCTKQILGTNC